MTVSIRTTLTPPIFAQRFAAAKGDDWTLLNPTATDGPCQLECKGCGRTVEATPWRALCTDPKARAVCPACRKKTGSKPQTVEAWQAKLDAFHGAGEYTLLDREYVSNTQFTRPYSFRHRCGITFETLLGSLLAPVEKGSRCPCQRVKVRRDETVHTEELAAAHGTAFELVDWAGSGNRARHTYRHTACGLTFKRYALHAVQRNFCPHCDGANGNLRARHTVDSVQPLIDTVHGAGEYTVTGVEHAAVAYASSTPVTNFRVHLVHTCGHAFTASRNTFRTNTHLGRCPICFGTSRQVREVAYGGKTFRVLGYEERALQELLKRQRASSIMSRGEPGFPVIRYMFHKKEMRYFPDFYIPLNRTIVEVKSPATAGLIETDNKYFEGGWDKLKAKARRCIKLGYTFKLMLYTGRTGDALDIPDDWLSLTKYQMAQQVGIRIKRTRKSRGE